MSEGGAEVGRQSRLVRFAFASRPFWGIRVPPVGAAVDQRRSTRKCRRAGHSHPRAYSAAPPLLQRSRSATTPATIAGEFVGAGKWLRRFSTTLRCVGDRGNSGRTGRMHRTSAVRMMSGRLTFESDFAAIVRLLPQLGYARDNGVEGGSRTKECRMISPKISRQEWPVMEELWRRERLSIREIQTALSGPDRRPAYSTVQTMVYRLEARGAVRRVEKIRNHHVFEACVTREVEERQIVANIYGSSKDGSGLSSSSPSRWEAF